MNFTLQGDEFSKCIDVDGYNLFRGSQVFVLWNWIRIEDSCSQTPESDSNPEDYSLPPDNDSTSESDEDSAIPEITHTVVFKCIGAHK